MSMSAMMLAGYYLKAGAPKAASELIGAVCGDSYLQYQAVRRREGAGNKAKALAALDICNDIVILAARYEDNEIWGAYKDPATFSHVIDFYSAALICRRAVYAYALDDNSTEFDQEDLSKFLDIASSKAQKNNINFNRSDTFESIMSQVHDTAIRASALGSKKGLWSKVFG